jgi:hypothetical protein
VPTLDNISILALGLLIYLLFIWITVTLLWIYFIKDLTPATLYCPNLNFSFIFCSHKNKGLCFGWYVVILKLIKNFTSFFFILPSCVRLEIIRIQRNFLWGGTSGDGSKIPWVKWSDVCRPKKEGGLRIWKLLIFPWWQSGGGGYL